MIPRVIPLSNPLGKGELHHKNLNWDVKIREKRIFLIATNKKKKEKPLLLCEISWDPILKVDEWENSS